MRTISVPTIHRRQLLSALAVGITGATATDWPPGQSPTPPLVPDQPQISLSHTLDHSGHLTVELPDDRIPQSVQVLLLSYPDATVRAHLQTDADGTAVTATIPLADTRRDGPFVCVVYDAAADGPLSEWQYLGETAPFAVGSDVRRAYHRTERDSRQIDWSHLPSIGRAPDLGVVERIERAGSYRLEFETLVAPPPSARWVSTTLDIGKTAYAQAQQGVLRNPAAEFDRARTAPAIRQLLTALETRIETDGEHGPVRERLFNAAVAFAQSLPYLDDFNEKQMFDYAKTPIETLVEGGGDCEDKAILLGGLLAQPELACDPILVFPPGHAAVAAKTRALPDGIEPRGSTITHDGDAYTFVEGVGPLPVGQYFDERKKFDKSNLMAIYDGSWSHLNPRQTDDAIRSVWTDWA